MTPRFLQKLIAATLLVYATAAGAEDIELFMNPTPASVDKPNVLFIVDNTANWNTPFDNEKAALQAVFAALPADSFRVGVMFASETGGSNTNTESGGYVRAALRLMTENAKTKYGAMIGSLDKLGDKGNGGESSLVMAEAYRYFSGGAPFAGNGKVKTDYLGNTSGTSQSNEVYALAGNALSAFDGTQYYKPTSDCQRNFIIYISNGDSADNTAVLEKSLEMLTAAGTAEGVSGATRTFALSPSGSQGNWMDEWAYLMKKSALKVTTFTIDVDPKTTGQGPAWSALLKSMASVTDGTYFAVSSADSGQAIVDAVNKVLSNIQAENSVFASVSLPVSVNTQGTYLNQVFVGMFRPAESAMPRWAGNMKHYKIGYTSTGKLGLLDAAGIDAISSTGTGFFDVCSRSYWTPTAIDTYWTFRPQGSCAAVANSIYSNYPDGDVVEKGAQAYKLRSTTARTVKTCSPVFTSCTTMTEFNTTNVTPEMLGLASTNTTERDLLVAWAKGLDIDDENGNYDPQARTGKTNEMRASAHADVVHSRPVAVNYGTDAAPQVVVYYGTNDGLLRAVNGNRDGGAEVGGAAPGMELWSFMAPEFYPHIKRLRDNDIAILLPDQPTGLRPPPEPKRYGFDGPIGVYNVPGTTWIYPTMRRGGRMFYAFDVTNPGSPVLKWKKGCPSPTSDDGCSDGYSGIGQTWSAPKSLKTLGYGSGTSPLLIMGGGYDGCEDADPNSCANGTKGNRIYVLDANTGERLRAFETERAVAADVFVVPDTTNGMAKFAYAVDLGGNVYRISGASEFTPFGNSAPSEWEITKIASLGCDTANTTCSGNRKFMFMPDVVAEGSTYTLLVGSGDREKPLSADTYPGATSVANYFFMIKDKPTDTAWLESESARCGNGVICFNSLYPVTGSNPPTPATLADYKGWRLPMTTTEQVVTSAITVFGTVTFSSHKPAVYDAAACTSGLGDACVYNLDYTNGANVIADSAHVCQEIAGGGLPPSPVAGMVTLDGADTNGDGVPDAPGQTVPFIIGASPKSALEGGTPIPPATAFQPKTRVYWNIQQ